MNIQAAVLMVKESREKIAKLRKEIKDEQTKDNEVRKMLSRTLLLAGHRQPVRIVAGDVVAIIEPQGAVNCGDEPLADRVHPYCAKVTVTDVSENRDLELIPGPEPAPKGEPEEFYSDGDE